MLGTMGTGSGLRPVPIVDFAPPGASRTPDSCSSLDMADQLTLDDVAKVADLARLELSDGERQSLTHQLNDILVQFARLQELDTTDVQPTAHSIPMTNVLREDTVRPSLPRDAATANAPERRDGNFIVPQVVEQ